jgi:hypothetical protein
MKLSVLLVLLAIVLTAAVLLQGCAYRQAAGQPLGFQALDEQDAAVPFVVKEAELPTGFPLPGPVGRIVVKQYPAYRAAVQSAQTPDGRQSPNGMFNPLFKHITRNDIAMTAPVEMSYQDGDQKPISMAFLYGDPSIGKTGADQSVNVVDLPPVTVLSIGVRGDYDEQTFNTGLAALRQWLKDNPDKFQPAGPPRFLGYNSPFVPSFWAFGEVQIPVR